MSRDRVLLEAVLREIEVLPKFIDDTTLEMFMDSEIKQRAVCMTLLNIGELIKKVSDHTKEKHHYIAWEDITRLRDIAAHQYQSLNMERIYYTATKFIPVFKENIHQVLRSLV